MTTPTYQFAEAGCKMRAKLLLADKSKRLLVPCAEEWWGIGMLERDDELPNLPSVARKIEKAVKHGH